MALFTIFGSFVRCVVRHFVLSSVDGHRRARISPVWMVSCFLCSRCHFTTHILSTFVRMEGKILSTSSFPSYSTLRLSLQTALLTPFCSPDSFLLFKSRMAVEVVSSAPLAPQSHKRTIDIIGLQAMWLQALEPDTERIRYNRATAFQLYH